MTLTWSNASKDNVPPGSYKTEFIGTEPSNHEQYGAGFRWRFKVLEGEHAGKIVSRQTGPKPSPKNGCGRMLLSMLGRTPNEGENIDPQAFVGKRFLAAVVQGEKGPRLEVVTPLP